MNQLSLLLLFFWMPGIAQTTTDADSLEVVVHSRPIDSVWFDVIRELSYVFLKEVDKTKAKTYARIMLQAAIDANDSVNLARAHESLSDYYELTSQFDSALFHDLEGMKIATQTGNVVQIVGLYCSISRLQFIQKDYFESEKTATAGLELFDATGLGDAVCLYGQLATNFSFRGAYDSAGLYFEKVITTIESTENPNMKQLAAAYTNYGANFFFLGNYEKAIELYRKASDTEIRFGIAEGSAVNLINIGEAYSYMNNYNQAEKYLNDGLILARKIKDRYVASSALYMLTDMYERRGNLAMAYNYYKQYAALKDSLFSVEKSKQLAEMQTLYETQKKENDILQLQQEKQVATVEIERQKSRNFLFGSVALVFLLLSGGVIFGYMQLRKAKAEVDRRNAVITDINKRLNASQDALMLSNKTKDKFFALVAHDLRGPITSLSGIGKLLNFNMKKGRMEKVEALINNIDVSAGKVNHLLDNLLKWALSQTGGLSYHPTPINISTLVRDSVGIFEEAAAAKNLSLRLALGEQDELVSADFNMISSVLRNLVSNAIKFTPQLGVVEVAVSKSGESVDVVVRDSGPGIPAGLIEKLKKKEVFASTDGSDGEKGTGLGLQLCHEFVARHHSELNISSSPGHGTIIVFSLKSIDALAEV
ncbi:MAG: tetratricopeptide repeat-containing sensor histidine kinase [Imperialibacter sp.]